MFLERTARDFRHLPAAFEAALERFESSCWVVFSFLYFAWALLISNHKQLWFDELVSYSVDHAPSWSEAWRDLQLGVDANPPLFHFVNRLLLGALGDTTLVQRASSILGFWVMSACVYAIVRRNQSAAAAWVAALVPVCSGAAYYATEARPYGMVLGFVSLAIICWLNAVEGSGAKRWWVVGLAICLACAISSHYYAVFTIAPFIGAELTQAVRRRRVDWTILAAVMFSYLPLILFYQAGLMSAANQYVGSTDRASLLNPIHYWEMVLGPVAGSILLAVGVALAWAWIGDRISTVTFTIQRQHIVAAWFCVLPIVVVLAARYVTHAYEHRYAITAVLGAAILIGAGFDALRAAIPGAAGLAALALLLPVSADAVMGWNKPRGRHLEYGWASAVSARPELPVVYGMPLEFVQGWYNAPTSELKNRITCLVDLKEARERTGSTTADLGVINLKPALPVPAVGYDEFVELRKPFYLLYEPSITSWVTKKLVEDGAELKLQGLFGADELYLVTWRPPETEPVRQPTP